MFTNYYKILGVARDASQEQIKKSFKEKLHEWHPDKNDSSNATEKTQKIIEAYEVLKNATSKKEYDRIYDSYFSSETEIVNKTFDEEKFKDWTSEYRNKAKTYSQYSLNEILSKLLDETKFHTKHVSKIGCAAYFAIGGAITCGFAAIKMIAEGELNTEGGAIGVPMFILISAGLVYYAFNIMKQSTSDYKSEMQDRYEK